MSYYTTNNYYLEINITYLCTLKCLNCDRSLSVIQETRDYDMTVGQIDKFIAQSVKLNYPWKRIRIMGGEPTLHQDFKVIVDHLYQYKQTYNKDVDLVISSNGHTPKTQELLKWVEEKYPEIIFENTKKKDRVQKDFNLIHVAPCDIHDKDEEYQYAGCWTTESAAISLDYSGFYCCAPGASIARVFGYDIGIKDMKKISVENMEKMFNPLCSKCGRYHEIKVDNNNVEVIMSPTWKEAVKKERKELTRY